MYEMFKSKTDIHTCDITLDKEEKITHNISQIFSRSLTKAFYLITKSAIAYRYMRMFNRYKKEMQS
jgi:hypothetical protein